MKSTMKAKIAYTGIRVKDLEKSKEFYTKLLGLKVAGESEIKSTKGKVVSLVSEEDGHSIELNYYEKGSPYATEYSVGETLDHLAFQVEDLQEALDEAKRAGYPTVLDIKTETSRWAYIQDPNGIFIELLS